MIRFLKWLFAGNAKIAVNKILEACEIYRGDYTAAFGLMTMTLLQNARKSPNYNSVLLLTDGKIRNFTELAALDLNLFAAPEGTTFSETLESFKGEIENHLRKGGVSEIFISGDIRGHLTRD